MAHKQTSSLKAGAAAVDITPSNLSKCFLAGFAPNRKCREVLDPIYARALYVSDGKTELALVACDLIGLSWSNVAAIRSRISGMPQGNVLVHCTHTHSGPDTMGLWGRALGDLPVLSGLDPQYMEFLFDEVAFAVAKAQRAARPARACAATDERERGEWVWNVRDRALIDNQLVALKFDDEQGRTIATLVNFGCHPETLWEHNHALSPDYPRHVVETIERSLGGCALFVSGALGGMVTAALPEDAPQQRRREFTRELGEYLAGCALVALAKALPIAPASIDYRRSEVLLPFDNKMLAFVSNMGILGERRPEAGKLRSEVAVLRLGPLTALTFPGEVLPAVGLQAKALLQSEHKMLFALCNDELGYILPERDYGTEKYKYESSMSVGPRTAPQILKALSGLLAE